MLEALRLQRAPAAAEVACIRPAGSGAPSREGRQAPPGTPVARAAVPPRWGGPQGPRHRVAQRAGRSRGATLRRPSDPSLISGHAAPSVVSRALAPLVLSPLPFRVFRLWMQLLFRGTQGTSAHHLFLGRTGSRFQPHIRGTSRLPPGLDAVHNPILSLPGKT